MMKRKLLPNLFRQKLRLENDAEAMAAVGSIEEESEVELEVGRR